MKVPNLFDYATSELSQDAFICWLLSWASPSFQTEDKALHECGVALITAFFNKKGIVFPKKIETVKISKQDKNIDVLCIVNGKYSIIVEDKVDTKDHSMQLEKYYNEVLSRSFEEHNIIPIYFKTEDQSNYLDIENRKYKPFLRDDFLDVLNSYSGNNQILVDYRKRLIEITAETESYLITPPEEWTWRAWKGFYIRLQKELSQGDWGYIPNQSGGFLGYWWGFKNDSECQQHLQLESYPSRPNTTSYANKLHLKIKVEDRGMRSSLRDKWCKRYTTEANALGLKFKKPDRFGNGKHMTVSNFSNYIQCTEGLVNIEKTISILQRANEVLINLYENE